jgi:hypothetical protein
MWSTFRRAGSRLLALLLTAGVLLVGCQRVDPVVKIGLVAPFEGRDRAVGYDVIYSARLAVREINRAGGVGGYRVALVAFDDSGDPALAADVAQALVVDPAVMAVIGHWQPETTAAAAAVYEREQLAFIAMGDGRYGRTDVGELSAEFTAAYAAVTPFDELPGPYAATTYAALRDIFATLDEVAKEYDTIDRTAVSVRLMPSKQP